MDPRIGILLVVHIIAGIAWGNLADDGQATLSLAFYIGLTFCQTSMLGIWSGLGPEHWFIRLGGLALGTTYLVVIFGWGLSDLSFEVVFITTLSAVAVAGVMLAVRYFARLRRPDAATGVVPREPLQFSLWHLLVLTTVVACLLTIGKWLQPYFSVGDDLAMLVALGLCFVSVGVAAVWAMLGNRHVWLRSMIVLLLAAATASIPNIIGGDRYGFWLMIMLSQAGLLLISLFIVRQCGYRLLPVSSKVNGPREAVTPNAVS